MPVLGVEKKAKRTSINWKGEKGGLFRIHDVVKREAKKKSGGGASICRV